VRCEQFVIHRHTLRETLSIPDDQRFHVILVIDGAAKVSAGDDTFALSSGTTVLLPADRAATHIAPDNQPAVVLDAFLP
jgi:mannose-6-phosphate isomerase class I